MSTSIYFKSKSRNIISSPLLISSVPSPTKEKSYYYLREAVDGGPHGVGGKDEAVLEDEAGLEFVDEEVGGGLVFELDESLGPRFSDDDDLLGSRAEIEEEALKIREVIDVECDASNV